MHSSTQRFLDSAKTLGLNLNIVTHEESTRTADEAAAAVGVEVGQIVKSLCFVVNGEPTAVLVSGKNRLDTKKLAKLCGVGNKKVKRADPDTVKSATGFTIGGVPPFGYVTDMPIYLDKDLNDYDQVWAAAGTPKSVFSITPADLLTATKGQFVNIKQE